MKKIIVIDDDPFFLKFWNFVPNIESDSYDSISSFLIKKDLLLSKINTYELIIVDRFGDYSDILNCDFPAFIRNSLFYKGPIVLTSNLWSERDEENPPNGYDYFLDKSSIMEWVSQFLR